MPIAIPGIPLESRWRSGCPISWHWIPNAIPWNCNCHLRASHSQAHETTMSSAIPGIAQESRCRSANSAIPFPRVDNSKRNPMELQSPLAWHRTSKHNSWYLGIGIFRHRTPQWPPLHSPIPCGSDIALPNCPPLHSPIPWGRDFVRTPEVSQSPHPRNCTGKCTQPRVWGHCPWGGVVFNCCIQIAGIHGIALPKRPVCWHWRMGSSRTPAPLRRRAG